MYDASGDTAMTVHSDGKARIWDIRNRTEIKQFDCGKTPLTCCAVHPNQAKIIAIGTEDAKILLYDLDSGNRIAQFSHKDWISGIEFSPDGTLLGSTSDDLTLRIWDIESSALVAAIALRESVFGCNWHPNGSQLLAVGAGGAARVSISRGNLTDGKGSDFD